MGTTQNNISDVSGNFTGTTANGLDGWTATIDLSADPSVTSIGGNFNAVSNGSNQGDPNGIHYNFSALSTTQFGTLSFNTANGTFTFTLNKSALYSSGSDQTISFTVRGLNGALDDTVLQVMSASSGAVTTLCPAEDVAVATGQAAFLRPEAVAGGTAACPAGSLNGDVVNDSTSLRAACTAE